MSRAHVRTRYGVKILQRTHPLIRSLSRERSLPSMHGTQVWRSSFMLMDYLAQNPLVGVERVMDLGCGWGLLGIYCAKHFPVDVLLIDADPSVFPYVETHVRLNEVQVQTLQVEFNGVPDRFLSEHDVLVGADICFWPELVTQLRRLIGRALSRGVRRILLADPGRSTFLRLAEDLQHRYEGRLIPWKTSCKVGVEGYLLVIER